MLLLEHATLSLVTLLACLLSVPAHQSQTPSDRPPAGEATVILDETLLDAALAGLLQNPDALRYPIGSSSRACRSEVRLLPDVAGTQTRVQIASDRITLPLAFGGTYNANLLGCLSFTGTARADLDLAFDESRRALVARIRIRSLDVRDLPALAGGSVRSLVQRTIDSRVNPVTILRLDDLTTRLPLSEAGALVMRAQGIYPQVRDRELRIRIRYEFVAAN